MLGVRAEQTPPAPLRAPARLSAHWSPNGHGYASHMMAKRASDPPALAAGRDGRHVLLPFTPPLDFAWLLRFLAARAIPGVAAVRDGTWCRVVRMDAAGTPRSGWIAVDAAASGAALRLRLAPALEPLRARIIAGVRRQFALDADPRPPAAALGALMRPWPGVRVPGACDGFETAVRAILGQQVTVAAASTLAGRLARTLGTPVATPHAGLTHAFPDAARLAAADTATLGQLGIVRSRGAAIRALAAAVRDGAIDLTPQADPAPTLRALEAIRGIGPWTAHYLGMRALGWADAFPAADHGVLRALDLRRGSEARRRAEGWRPFRAWAVICLWRSLEAAP